MLTLLDHAVLLAYLAVVAAVGLFASRGQRDGEDYLLASRRIPWWAVGISIVATETSALTFLGAPIQSLRGDWTYLQLTVGSAIGRLGVAFLLLGLYYRAEVVTVYDWLGLRFGPLTRNLSTGLFFVGRLLGSGVRLYGGAIALVVVAGMPFPIAIFAIAGVAVLYTLMGGLRSVIWTDAVQGVLLLLGVVLAIVWLSRGEGLFALLDAAADVTVSADGATKTRLINPTLNPAVAYTLFAGVIGSAVLTLSTHGTDQDLVQRTLACTDVKEARRGMVLSAVIIVPLTLLFLIAGTLLWTHYGGDEGAARAAALIATEHGLANGAQGYDFLFARTLVDLLPAGLRGLVLAAVLATAMSSLDSAMAALSSTAVTARRPAGAKIDDALALATGRRYALFFGAILVAVALVVWQREAGGSSAEGFGILRLGLQVLSWIFPPLLGVVLVGALTNHRGSDRGNLLALSVSIGTLLLIEMLPGWTGQPTPFAWTWNPIIGCSMSAAIASCFSGKERT